MHLRTMMLRMGKGFCRILTYSHWNKQVMRRLCSTSPLATYKGEDQKAVEFAINLAELESSTEKGDVSTLLQRAAASPHIEYSFKALDILAKWNSTKKVDFIEEVEKDPNFPKILSVVEKKANYQSISEIIRALTNLLDLGVKTDSFIIESLENDLLWNVRKVSVRSLLNILVFQLPIQETPRQKNVVEQTVAAIERRWVEFQNAREIALIYKHHKIFHPNFIGHIDDRVIELVESMRSSDLAKIICALGESSRRATPILRAIAFHIAKKNDPLTPKQISNILFALKSLNFPDTMLLERLSIDLTSQINEISQPSIIGTVLTCMGQLRWRPTALLDSISLWMEKNIELSRTTEYVSFILTLGTVSYMPSNGDDLIDLLLPRLKKEELDNNIWLDIVWSLVLMRKATKDHISSVLSVEFLNDLPISDISNLGLKLKLLNINAAAQLLFPTYSGPFLDSIDDKSLLITQSRKDLSLTKHVFKTLHNFLPPPKYTREDLQTPMGITIDVELAVDNNGRPLPIANYRTPFAGHSHSEPLPNGAFCVALLIFNYKDFTIGTQELMGIKQLTVDLLQKKGYKVLQIPYFEYSIHEKTLKNVQYFETKIKNCLAQR